MNASVIFLLRWVMQLLLLQLFVFVTATNASDYSFLDSITSQAYPNAHYVLSYEDERVEFRQDGSSVESDEVFITVLDQDGVRRNSVISFYMNRHYSRLKIKFLKVIGADGFVRDVDLERYSREDTVASVSRMNIYDPAQREIKVFVPELHPGDTVHYLVEQENFKSMIPGEFFGKKTAEYAFPVRHYRLEIAGPADRPVNFLIKDNQPDRVTERVENNGQVVSHIFEFRDVPALVPEPSMPPMSEVSMRVLYSTIPSWAGVSRWYARLVEPHLEPSPEITAKVRKLCQGASGRDEKLAAIFYFVAQKIRYMGITAEADRPGYEPHDVSLTFSRRYGVCRDKAALLVTMLREAGFDAVPVMIRAGGRLDPELPVPWFNHAITAVVDENGRPVTYLDPTSETSRQFLPDYERHSSCLPALEKGADLLMTPDPDAGSNLTIIEIRDRLHDDGSLSGSLEFRLTGFCDTAIRGAMMNSSYDKRRQLVEQLVQGRVPGIEPEDISWSDPADRNTPMSFRCTFTARNRTGVMAGGSRIFYPLSAMKYIGVLDVHLLQTASLSSRKYPLRFDYVIKSILKESTELPPGEAPLIMLPDRSVSFSQASAGYQAELHGNILEIRRELENLGLEVPPDKYRQILEVQKFMRDAALVPVILPK